MAFCARMGLRVMLAEFLDGGKGLKGDRVERLALDWNLMRFF